MPQQNENQFDYVTATLPGIVIGSLLYCNCTGLVVNLFLAVYRFSSFCGLQIWATLAVTFGCSIVFGAIFGTFFLIALAAFNWTLGNVLSPRTVAMAAACATGYFPTALFALGIWYSELGNFIFSTVLLLGPLLASTVVSLSSWRFQHSTAMAELKYPAHQPNQFSIRTLMVLTAWFAVAVPTVQAIYRVVPWIWVVLLGYVVVVTAIVSLTQLLEKSREPVDT